jgi:hypothetical protein
MTCSAEGVVPLDSCWYMNDRTLSCAIRVSSTTTSPKAFSPEPSNGTLQSVVYVPVELVHSPRSVQDVPLYSARALRPFAGPGAVQ